MNLNLNNEFFCSINEFCKNLKQYPKIHNYFKNLIKEISIVETKVHPLINVDPSIRLCKLDAYFNTFIVYLVKRNISEARNLKFKDEKVSSCLKSIKEAINDESEFYQKYQKTIEKVENMDLNSLDILSDICVYSYSHGYINDKKFLPEALKLNKDDFKEINAYIKKKFGDMGANLELSPSFTNDYLNTSNNDILIYNNELINIKNSKFNLKKNIFYQLFLYGYFRYANTGETINKYSIYNPLLGLEYSIEINIDFKLLQVYLNEDLLTNDIEYVVYSILKQNKKTLNIEQEEFWQKLKNSAAHVNQIFVCDKFIQYIQQKQKQKFDIQDVTFFMKNISKDILVCDVHCLITDIRNNMIKTGVASKSFDLKVKTIDDLIKVRNIYQREFFRLRDIEREACNKIVKSYDDKIYEFVSKNMHTE